MDPDFVCLKPLDDLLYKYKVFFSIEPSQPWAKVPIISPNTIIGTIKNHMLFENQIEIVKRYYKNLNLAVLENLKRVNDETIHPNEITSKLIWVENLVFNCGYYRTGKYCHDKVIVFPPSYFSCPFMPKDEYLASVRPYYDELAQNLDFSRDIVG